MTDVPVPEPGRPQHAAGPPPSGSPLSPGGYPMVAASPNSGPAPYPADRRPDAVGDRPRYVGPPAPPPGWPQIPSAWRGPSSAPPSSVPPASAPPSSAPPSSGAPWRALAPADRQPTSASPGPASFGPGGFGPAAFGAAGFSPGSGGPTTDRRPRSLRPIYREPFPARPGTVVIGAVAGAVWMLLFGLLGHSARSYCWWTIGAALAGWAAAAVLARSGDRGVAAGAAMSTGVGLAIAMSVVVTHWLGGHWLLW